MQDDTHSRSPALQRAHVLGLMTLVSLTATSPPYPHWRMELINVTRMAAGCSMGIEPTGRELLVVVVKGTFVLPKSAEQVRLHDEQVPLVMADTFSGEPGFS